MSISIKFIDVFTSQYLSTYAYVLLQNYKVLIFNNKEQELIYR